MEDQLGYAFENLDHDVFLPDHGPGPWVETLCCDFGCSVDVDDPCLDFWTGDPNGIDCFRHGQDVLDSNDVPGAPICLSPCSYLCHGFYPYDKKNIDFYNKNNNEIYFKNQ